MAAKTAERSSSAPRDTEGTTIASDAAPRVLSRPEGRLVAAIAASALLAGCLAAREPPPPRGQINVFISPAGQPFVGGPDAPYPIDAWFAHADADHDGALSLEEFQADARAFFQVLDKDHDGVISGGEITDYEQTIAPQILPRVARLTARDIPHLPDSAAGRSEQRQREEGREVGGRRGGRDFRGGASAFSLTPEPEPVAAADADFDGKVTLSEFLAMTQSRFRRLDLDHDGRLLRSELPRTPAERLADRKHRGRRGERR